MSAHTEIALLQPAKKIAENKEELKPEGCMSRT